MQRCRSHRGAPPRWRVLLSEPFCLRSLSFDVGSALFLTYEKISLLDTCGTSFHCVRTASSAFCASCALGAATPTKSPSRTTTTPLMAFAALSSQETSVAPNDGGRRTLP